MMEVEEDKRAKELEELQKEYLKTEMEKEEVLHDQANETEDRREAAAEVERRRKGKTQRKQEEDDLVDLKPPPSPAERWSSSSRSKVLQRHLVTKKNSKLRRKKRMQRQVNGGECGRGSSPMVFPVWRAVWNSHLCAGCLLLLRC